MREGDSTTEARQVTLKGYLSPDRRMIVILTHLVLTPSAGGGDGAFVYEIMQLPAALTQEQAQRLIDREDDRAQAPAKSQALQSQHG